MVNTKRKILLLSMGGTIFSIVEKNVVRIAENIEELVALVPRIKDVAQVSLEIVKNLDSTNVGSPEWIELIHRIAERYDDYDGFVVAHGTNTMAYTATATAFGLGSKLAKPVVFTGSQLPLTTYGDDARFNLEHSVLTAVTAIEKNIAEVMVCFNARVFRGTRTVKISETDFAAFNSPALEPVARIDANGVIFAPHARQSPNDFFRAPSEISFSDSVLCIDLVPGLHPRTLFQLIDEKEHQIKGIVIKSHGAGSVPDVGDMSLIPFIEHATDRGVPIVVTTKFLGGNSYRQTNDEPAVRALRAGAVASRDMTDVAAQVKLMYLLASGASYNQIVERFTQPIVGEVT